MNMSQYPVVSSMPPIQESEPTQCTVGALVMRLSEPTQCTVGALVMRLSKSAAKINFKKQ